MFASILARRSGMLALETIVPAFTMGGLAAGSSFLAAAGQDADPRTAANIALETGARVALITGGFLAGTLPGAAAVLIGVQPPITITRTPAERSPIEAAVPANTAAPRPNR